MPKYFVNRGGGRVPEGPFEEQQIVRLILAGKLRAGHVCEEGLQRFTPLEAHPLFKQALAQVGIVPAPEALEARARPVAGQRRGTSRGMLFGAVLAFFGLAIGAVAIGTYVMFNTGGMPAHAAMPGDTELLFEVTSVRGAVGNLSTLRGLDTKQLALLEDTTNALSASFGVPKAKVSALLLATSSLGLGARKLASAPEAGVVLTFSSATPVNGFLSSKRFSYYGLVSTNGRKYKVAPAAAGTSSSDATTSTLSGLHLDDPNTVLVWFETSKVLFVGAAAFASDVSRALSLDAPSLDLNPKFKSAQRDWLGKPDAVAYLDPTQLSALANPELKPWLDGAFNQAPPVSGSLTLLPAGLLTHLVARVSAPAAAPGSIAVAVPPARPLSIADRLPSETFAYVAAATKTGLSGADLRRVMLEQIQRQSPALSNQISAQLAQAESRFDLSFERILGSLGDQGVLAAVAPADYRIELLSPAEAAARFAVVYLQELEDPAPTRALFAEAKAQFEHSQGAAQIQEDPDGYTATVKDNAQGLLMQVRFSKNCVFVGIGNGALVARGAHAFSAGEATLASVAAYHAARAALPASAQILMWADAGRIVSTVQQNPLLAPRIHELGLDREVIRWTGPDRITTALALNAELHGGTYTYRVDALNLPVLAGFLRVLH